MRLHLIVLSSLFATHVALAQEPSINGRRLTATCANCHGTNGISAGSALPTLAGQPKDALIGSMKAFKDGSRPATVMHQIAKGYSDQQIESIAAYLAAQKK